MFLIDTNLVGEALKGLCADPGVGSFGGGPMGVPLLNPFRSKRPGREAGAGPVSFGVISIAAVGRWHQPSTFTFTLVRVWALGTSTVSSPSR